jgi:hypothetical protein
MIGDWVVEEMVDLWSCHDVGSWLIGGALYYQSVLQTWENCGRLRGDDAEIPTTRLVGVSASAA